MNKAARARVLRNLNPHINQRKPLSSWTIVIVALAIMIALPIFSILLGIFSPSNDVWLHLSSTVLPRYIENSLWLMLGVGLSTLIIGVSTAWLVTMCSFPGKRLFEWALLLPMAIPAYILAYTYTDFLQFAGPVQSFIRDSFELRRGEYWFPAIRSLGGAISLLSLAFYPYVYLLTRAAFLEQSTTMLEATQCLRCNPWTSFFRISLPMARPAIAAGIALALMETLSDFGTVDYFGIQTFTTGIYRTWFGLGERGAAVQLSAWLLLFVLILIVLERLSRRQWQRNNQKTRMTELLSYQLGSWRAMLAFFTCLIPLTLGFFLPASLLIRMALTNTAKSFNPNTWFYAQNSLLLAAITALLAVTLGLVMAYGTRIRPNVLNQAATRVASMGYAIPGSVIAVSVLVNFAWLDQRVNSLSELFFASSPGLIFSGTVFGLIFAYLVRFLTASFNTVEAGLKTITQSMDAAARSLGHNSLSRLQKVHIPLLRGSLFTAAILVFVDVIKELPATLIVRPFNFDTLAVRVYRLASDERLIEASGGALGIVIAGIVPVILLSLAITKADANKSKS